MDNQLIRLVILMGLVYVLTSDIKELMQILSTTSSIGPYFSWMKSQEDGQKIQQSSRSTFKNKHNVPNSNNLYVNEVNDSGEEEEEEEPLRFYTPIPTGRSRSTGKSNVMAENGDDENSVAYRDSLTARKRRESILGTLTDEEKAELIALKSHLTKVMQEWCLPKLVCELHASVGERDTMNDAERGLLSIIRETSMNPMGEVISRYHFAAHMGQLLADVEGNGCHNFYPNCPLSGSKVLQMVKKVRIR